jgi:hypothetical protein
MARVEQRAALDPALPADLAQRNPLATAWPRLDVPALRTLFGAKKRPHTDGHGLSPKVAAAIETPRWDLTMLKVNFGSLTLKGHAKGERVLRLEAVAHNAKKLGLGRRLRTSPRSSPGWRHDRAVRHRPGLRRHHVPARRDPRRAADPLPDRCHPGRRPAAAVKPLRENSRSFASSAPPGTTERMWRIRASSSTSTALAFHFASPIASSRFDSLGRVSVTTASISCSRAAHRGFCAADDSGRDLAGVPRRAWPARRR